MYNCMLYEYTCIKNQVSYVCVLSFSFSFKITTIFF